MSKAIRLAVVSAALMIGLGASALASPADHYTRFTFNQPIALPGVTLPAGTYVFRLADPGIERKTVQVLDADGTHSLMLLHAAPRYRATATAEPALALLETIAGMPSAIATWWPEGETVGFEFLYPPQQYARLTGIEPDPSVVHGDGLARLQPTQATTRVRRAAPAPSVVPAVARRQVTVTETLPAPDTTDAARPPAVSPLMGVIGVLLLIGAFAVGRVRA